MIGLIVDVLSAFPVGIIGVVGDGCLGFLFPGGIEGFSRSNALYGVGVLLALGKLVAVFICPCLEHAYLVGIGNGDLFKGIVNGVAVIALVCGDVLFAVLTADILGIVGDKDIGHGGLFDIVPNGIKIYLPNLNGISVFIAAYGSCAGIRSEGIGGIGGLCEVGLKILGACICKVIIFVGVSLCAALSRNELRQC